MKLARYINREEPNLAGVVLAVCGLLLLAVPFTCTSRNPRDGQIALTVWAQFDTPQDINLFVKQVRDFERQHPGIDVKVERVGASRRNQKYLAAMQADAAADLVMLHWRDIPQFAAKDMLVPLEPYYEGDEAFAVDDFFPRALDAFTFRRRQVALPEKGSTQLLFYNKDLFDRAGVGYPNDEWTFEDVVEAATRIIDSTPPGESPPLGLIPLDAAPWVWSSGGDFANDELTENNFTDRATVDGVTFLWRLRNDWQVTSRNLTAQGIDAAEVDVLKVATSRWRSAVRGSFRPTSRSKLLTGTSRCFPRGPPADVPATQPWASVSGRDPTTPMRPGCYCVICSVAKR